MTEILIDFDPYRVTMPPVERFVGKVQIMLPEHHFRLYDLSMGMDLLKGAHIGGDARCWALKLNLPEPGMTASDMMAFLQKSEKQIVALHKLVQDELDKAFLLERKGK
ncbi:MAG: hypothetical protein ABIG68_11750 [Acidobacteriota bacterium]